MKVITIWQPWASLIMIGAKPDEFRKWDYRQRVPGVENKRIGIHAGARPIRAVEVRDLIRRCEAKDTSLIPEKALPLLWRLYTASKCRGVIEMSAVLGTVVIGTPTLIEDTFQIPDSDRLVEHMHAWPVIDPAAFREPVQTKGFQGFWDFPDNRVPSE